jgi:hypothetical protein
VANQLQTRAQEGVAVLSGLNVRDFMVMGLAYTDHNRRDVARGSVAGMILWPSVDDFLAWWEAEMEEAEGRGATDFVGWDELLSDELEMRTEEKGGKHGYIP